MFEEEIGTIPQIETVGSGSNALTIVEDNEIVFHSNGCSTFNSQMKFLENGKILNPGLMEDFYCFDDGSVWNQGTTSIQFSINEYLLLNLNMESPFPPESPYFSLVPTKIFSHSIIVGTDTTYVENANHVILQDTFARGYLQAVKNDFEDDWTLIIPKWNSNCYWFVNFSNNEYVSNLQCIGPDYSDDDIGGQVAVSPNLKKYARYDSENFLTLFEYNRCDKVFTDYKLLEVDSIDFSFGGIEFSSNSRFLYVSIKNKVFQFDLESDNIQNSKELIGYVKLDELTNGKQVFYMMKRGANGKIYISSPGSYKFLSLIESPNEKGILCDFKPHLLELHQPSFGSLSNTPNFNPSYLNDCMTSTSTIQNYNYNIYPNPTTSICKLADFKVNYRLFNSNGNLISEGYESQIDLSNFNSTFFIVQLKIKGKIISKKVLKL